MFVHRHTWMRSDGDVQTVGVSSACQSRLLRDNEGQNEGGGNKALLWEYLAPSRSCTRSSTAGRVIPWMGGSILAKSSPGAEKRSPCTRWRGSWLVKCGRRERKAVSNKMCVHSRATVRTLRPLNRRNDWSTDPQPETNTHESEARPVVSLPLRRDAACAIQNQAQQETMPRHLDHSGK